MEPVTHILTGACLARAGFNRRAAYATLAMAVAAELPDIDTLWSLRGPVEGFAHHRGITHTFVGMPFEAALVVGAVYGLHRWRTVRAIKVPVVPNRVHRPLTKAPVRWGFLYGCVLLALLSHLLLDFTNNYGLRPFFPLDTHWYAASITFIFDPLMFALLLMALVIPQLLGLVSAEVGTKKKPFRGRGLAISALILVVALWALRYTEREEAERLALQQTYELQEQPVAVAEIPTSPVATDTDAADAPARDASPVRVREPELLQPPGQMLRVQRVQTSPDPVNPFRWAVAMDFGSLYQLGTVDTLAGDVTSSDLTYPKRDNDSVLRAAEGSALGRAYLDWSSMPILTVEQPTVAGPGDPRLMKKITFRDPRFMGDIQWLRTSNTPPLTGVVTVDDGGRVVRQSLNGRREPAGREPIQETHLDRSWAAFWKPKAVAPKPAVRQAAPVEIAKSVSPKPMVAAPRAAATPEVAKPIVIAEAAKPKPVVQPAPVVTPPTVAKPVATAVAPVKAVVPPAPSRPVAHATIVAKNPSSVTAPKQTTVEADKTPPAKSEPGIFDRGTGKISAETRRFRNWIHWLTNAK
jgi:inner membrane protein